ncbi:hypothetical protein MRB53_021828 [Persea americana]|uniref:Uncharacterized protein n=1 Tax=Persea americana TaxID=3435 RepID=A0ACC2L5R0_PERAE|nr:hypothetical protein MRB53_021828 [Persea americana]
MEDDDGVAEGEHKGQHVRWAITATTWPAWSGAGYASMFPLKIENNDHLTEVVQVIPILCYGAKDGLDEAAGLV